MYQQHYDNACTAAGVLIAPLWESALYWPLVRTTDGGFRPFITDFEVFVDATHGILELGDYKDSLLGSRRFKSPLIALRFFALTTDSV